MNPGGDFDQRIAQIIGQESQRNLEYSKSYIDTKKAIQEGKIKIGMSWSEIKIYGLPNEINRTVGVWGENTQRIYTRYWGGYSRDYLYLYFDNGILTAWQD